MDYRDSPHLKRKEANHATGVTDLKRKGGGRTEGSRDAYVSRISNLLLLFENPLTYICILYMQATIHIHVHKTTYNDMYTYVHCNFAISQISLTIDHKSFFCYCIKHIEYSHLNHIL